MGRPPFKLLSYQTAIISNKATKLAEFKTTKTSLTLLERKENNWLLKNVYFGWILTVRRFWHVAFEIEFFIWKNRIPQYDWII